jgi:hypothetical protein
VIVWPGFPAFLTSSPPADKQFKHLQEPHHGRSPRFATDLLFDRYQGEVTDHDAFWTVRTPGSQTTTSATTVAAHPQRS